MAKACAAADRAIDRLIKLLATDDEELNQDTALALLQFGNATVTRLGEMLPRAKDPKLRCRIVNLLGALGVNGDSSVVPALSRVLDEERDMDTWFQAVLATGGTLTGMRCRTPGPTVTPPASVPTAPSA
jgi:hypothetical protein